MNKVASLKTISDEFAEYALNLAATNIVLLVETDKSGIYKYEEDVIIP